jgi:hypothetical protein
LKSPLQIPEQFTDLVSALPESSYGATKVSLKLSDGSYVRDVTIAWGSEIAKVCGKPITSAEQLEFGLQDIVGIEAAE